MHTFSRRVATRGLCTLPIALAAPFLTGPIHNAAALEVDPLVIGEFVGVVSLEEPGTQDILVAVVADPIVGDAVTRTARAYLCNGEGLSEWFVGDLDGNSFSITSKGGALIEGVFDESGVGGSFNLADGTRHEFEAVRATGIEGLYHVTESELSSSGASSRGTLFQYSIDEERRLEGIFLLLDGTIEEVSVELPDSFLADHEARSASTSSEEGVPLTTNRVIVFGGLPTPQIVGNIKPRAQRCRYYKRIVTQANGTTVEEYVYICS